MINKKAFSPIIAIMLVGVVILAFYLLLFLPIPAFTSLRKTINYFLVIGLWFLIQALLIYFYFKMGFYTKKILYTYKNFLRTVSFKIQDYIITHV